MRINLRTDKVNPQHEHMTLFVNGQNTGKIVMSPEDAKRFKHALHKGSEHDNLLTVEETKLNLDV